MKKIVISVFLFIIAQSISFTVCANPANPVGFWKTVDDVTHLPRSIIQITEVNGQLEGKINKVFYRKGEGPNDVCVECSGSRQNQRILGMTILWGMRGHDDKWSGGHILDPQNGNTYHCQLTLIGNGNEMDVRGYIGFPLFGRTQHWNRVG